MIIKVDDEAAKVISEVLDALLRARGLDAVNVTNAVINATSKLEEQEVPEPIDNPI